MSSDRPSTTYVIRAWLGEAFRWYVTRARHPFKRFIVGRYWSYFCKPRVWIRYDGDRVLSVRLDEYVQERVFWDGYYERTIVEWLKRNLRPTDVFWDVGANVGVVTLVAAPRCRQVIAFEPDPRSAERLLAHVRANRLGNVTIVTAALGEAAGEAVLHQAPRRNAGRTSLVAGPDRATSPVTVMVLRADEFVAGRPELLPDVIKIDVEGAEHLVMRGARDILRRRETRALIFEDRADKSGEPGNAEVVASLRFAGLAVQPLGPSVEGVNDGMQNFLATRQTAAGMSGLRLVTAHVAQAR